MSTTTPDAGSATITGRRAWQDDGGASCASITPPVRLRTQWIARRPTWWPLTPSRDGACSATASFCSRTPARCFPTVRASRLPDLWVCPRGRRGQRSLANGPERHKRRAAGRVPVIGAEQVRRCCVKVRVIASGAHCWQWAPEAMDHGWRRGRARVSAMFLGAVPYGADAQGGASSQLVSTGQPVVVSQGLAPCRAPRVILAHYERRNTAHPRTTPDRRV